MFVFGVGVSFPLVGGPPPSQKKPPKLDEIQSITSLGVVDCPLSVQHLYGQTILHRNSNHCGLVSAIK